MVAGRKIASTLLCIYKFGLTDLSALALIEKKVELSKALGRRRVSAFIFTVIVFINMLKKPIAFSFV